MNDLYYILDASAFINGFEPLNDLNFTTPDILSEIKDFNSKMALEMALEHKKLTITEATIESINELKEVIKESGDDNRLSSQDINILSLALNMKKDNKNIILISDDYSIQNVAKILGIKFKSVLTEGVKTVYNWKKTCQGCKKEYPSDYKFPDCEICGSKIFKRRIKVNNR